MRTKTKLEFKTSAMRVFFMTVFKQLQFNGYSKYVEVIVIFIQ